MNAVSMYSVLDEGDSQKPLNMQYIFTGNIRLHTKTKSIYHTTPKHLKPLFVEALKLLIYRVIYTY